VSAHVRGLSPSLNQRVQGSSPCAPNIEINETKYEIGARLTSTQTALRVADPMGAKAVRAGLLAGQCGLAGNGEAQDAEGE
jgi:hypothetical protein